MGKRRRTSRFHGVLVVDKSSGPTSHDIVSRARRVFDTGAIGHSGTLDPMATGVLVLAIGEGTKLVPYLTADDKEYVATIRLGEETDSLDADGVITGTAPVPSLNHETVAEAAATFVGAGKQFPPKVSAIKVEGRRLYERVRRGEVVTVPERDVFVHEIEVTAVGPLQIELRVAAAKGFYVRSLARDLAVALGTVGHLSALRRLRSGRFDLSVALPAATLFDGAGGDAEAILEARSALLSLEDAWHGGRTTLTTEGVTDARHGRRIVKGRFGEVEGGADGVVALTEEDGSLVALARADDDGSLVIVRGFVPRTE